MARGVLPVNDIATLVQMVVAITVTVTPIIVLVPLIDGQPVSERRSRPGAAADGRTFGVREEDPLPWRFVRSTL
ncbi:MAG: hypothetical protein WEE50_02190 [Chloroflexota bacterium]